MTMETRFRDRIETGFLGLFSALNRDDLEETRFLLGYDGYADLLVRW